MMTYHDISVQSASGTCVVAEAHSSTAGPPPELTHIDRYGFVRVVHLDSSGDMSVVVYPPLADPMRGRASSSADSSMGAVNIDIEPISDTLRSLDGLNKLTLDEFVERHLDLRDELAYRSLRGDTLTQNELVTLQLLNAALKRLLPAPEPMPARVNDAIAEVRRLLGE